MKSAVFQVRIQVDEDTDVNPVHLCEEIQCYLNSNVCNLDESTDEYQDAKVVAYNFGYDNFVPFDSSGCELENVTDEWYDEEGNLKQ